MNHIKFRTATSKWKFISALRHGYDGLTSLNDNFTIHSITDQVHSQVSARCDIGKAGEKKKLFLLPLETLPLLFLHFFFSHLVDKTIHYKRYLFISKLSLVIMQKVTNLLDKMSSFSHSQLKFWRDSLIGCANYYFNSHSRQRRIRRREVLY